MKPKTTPDSTVAKNPEKYASKLDHQKAAEIRAELARGVSIAGLAKYYQVSHSAIKAIAEGRSYRPSDMSTLNFLSTNSLAGRIYVAAQKCGLTVPAYLAQLLEEVVPVAETAQEAAEPAEEATVVPLPSPRPRQTHGRHTKAAKAKKGQGRGKKRGGRKATRRAA